MPFLYIIEQHPFLECNSRDGEDLVCFFVGNCHLNYVFSFETKTLIDRSNNNIQKNNSLSKILMQNSRTNF